MAASLSVYWKIFQSYPYQETLCEFCRVERFMHKEQQFLNKEQQHKGRLVQVEATPTGTSA